MRASVIGLIALPIAASGLAAAAVAGFGLSDPPSAPAGHTAPAGITGEATDAAPAVDEEHQGTAIEGIKPFLSVIDGTSTLPEPAPIPSFLTRLTVPSVPLAPLPPQVHGPADPADNVGPRAEPGPDRIRDDLVPRDPTAGPGTGSGTDDHPVTIEPDSEGGGGGVRGDASADHGPGGRAAVPTPDAGWPPVAVPGPPAEGGTPAGPPPHAGENGRPPHADETGPPPHASRSPAGGAPVLGRPSVRDRVAGPPGTTAPEAGADADAHERPVEVGDAGVPAGAEASATESGDDHPMPR